MILPLSLPVCVRMCDWVFSFLSNVCVTKRHHDHHRHFLVMLSHHHHHYHRLTLFLFISFLIKPLRKHEFYSLSCCYSVFWCRHLNKGKRRWPISSVIIAIITNTQIGFSRNDDNVFPSQTHKRARTRTRTHKQTHTRSTPTHFYFASSFVFNSTF